MNITVKEPAHGETTRLAIVDADIHPVPRKPDELYAYLPERWRRHVKSFGVRVPQPFVGGVVPYPRMSAGNGRRMDSWPPAGGVPGSDLAFMQAQHLDLNGVEFGILHPLAAGSDTMDQDLGAALCTAVNDWQVEHWTARDKRLKASIAVTQDDPAAAVKEIERCARRSDFVQIAAMPRGVEPFGRRRYWPLFEAAVAHGLPIALHNSAHGRHANSGTGWVSYYIEEHYAMAHNMAGLVTSLVMEGVFERYPGLEIVLVEGGFAWAAALGWRLDRNWARMRDEVPMVKRPPSEYMRENIWYTTQPIEEPERPADLLDVIRWIGADRLLFSTDYPHWDFDDPRTAFQVRIPDAMRQAILRDNAMALYKLG